ncbi:hypothetical protein [Streptomyces sp. ITFR-16]|uniref:hypothetical protein n=1 Tax=Streptomyces sp. ITFR-16 TaxID=3075198 RepID=UPI00288C31D0|nr:hypothetical protein [Streptomyces sp. ITFR-16]WNI20416.1 hypothetical protein RLT58_00065 [Streptomyces sp. ITFR-16]
MATAVAMLDDGAEGRRARILAPHEPIPYGSQPVLVAETTVYGAKRVEELLLQWEPRPRPWLLLISDAPVRPAAGARYLIRAMEGRLAGVATLPYLPVLRAVAGPEEALEFKDVRAAAQKLRRTLGGN